MWVTVNMDDMRFSDIEMALASGYRAALYCRLSKDDDQEMESASIANQRAMLQQYCAKNGWEVVAVYQDDGYTGLNMDRPGLKKMLHAIEKGIVNLVITKDLSRLGRNYLETGRLMEDFFPRHGVRYIAMNDGIDTLRENNEIAPFKNILNDMYSRDISKKVHASYHLKATKGDFTGCVAPFGYVKDPANKNHLLIDPETAPIVRLIFGYALEGHGPNYIRRKLEEAKAHCPTWWNRQRGIRNTFTRWELVDPEKGRFIWDFSVIKDILRNPVYKGAIASQRCNYRFKVGTLGEKKPDEWIVVEGMHEPIISPEDFETVRQARLMGYTATPNYPLGIPANRPESKKKKKKKFLTYLYSDRAQKIIAKELKGLCYPCYTPDETVPVSDFVRTRLDAFGNDMIPIFPHNRSQMVYRGGLGDLVNANGPDAKLYNGTTAENLLATCKKGLQDNWQNYLDALK